MPRPQFADRTRWLTCNECDGRSFSDPTKTVHNPTCSKYREWRFGPRRRPVAQPHVEDMDSVLEDLYREIDGGGDV